MFRFVVTGFARRRYIVRSAGRLLGASHKTVWTWLNALVGDGILLAGEKGSRATLE
jgi:hypothetical protein